MSHPAGRSPTDRESGGITRRTVVRTGVAALAGLVGGCDSGRKVTSGPLPPAEKFPRRVLGRSGLSIPILQQGGDYYCAPRLMERCLELGVRAFDTAENYAQRKSEAMIGSCLAKLKVDRKSIILGTKSYVKQPADMLRKHVPESLKRLGTDYLDLWYVHDLDRPEVLSSVPWREGATELVKSGKMKCFGLSCHNDKMIDVMNAAARCGWVDVMMIRYNFRSWGDKQLDEAISACHKAGIGLIAMKTQASAVSFADRLDPFKKAGFNRHQSVLKAVWQDERITAIVSAMPTIRMIEENAAAAFDRLSVAEDQLLREHAVATADTYCSGGCGGCRRQCEAAMESSLAVADILRFLMYHDSYGRRNDARHFFGKLPMHRRSYEPDDLKAAEQACPCGLKLTRLIPKAFDRLA